MKGDEEVKPFIQGIDHVQICIPLHEEKTARSFYTGILKLHEIEKPNSLKVNGGLWYQAGNIQLHIGAEEFSSIKSKRHVAFEVTDSRSIRCYLEKEKIPIKDDTPIPGVERFSIYDPFGNRIEILSKDK